jgi:hypothetical protein
LVRYYLIFPSFHTRQDHTSDIIVYDNQKVENRTHTHTNIIIGMSIGQEVLEEFGDSLDMESVYIRGETAGDERVPFEMIFTEDGVEDFIVKLGTDSDYTINRFHNGSSEIAQIATKTNGAWSECFLTSMFENATTGDLQELMTTTLVDGARVIQSTSDDGDDVKDIAIVHEVVVNPSKEIMDAYLPTDDECINVPSHTDSYVPYTYADEANNVDNHTISEGRRLSHNNWYWQNGISDDYGFQKISFADHADLSTWAYVFISLLIFDFTYTHIHAFTRT